MTPICVFVIIESNQSVVILLLMMHRFVTRGASNYMLMNAQICYKLKYIGMVQNILYLYAVVVAHGNENLYYCCLLTFLGNRKIRKLLRFSLILNTARVALSLLWSLSKADLQLDESL